jgi:NDP-sugar pyrophosphorylase family protein
LPPIAEVPVAVLAGGLATRLRPVTETIPKALVDVGGRPFIEHQLDLFRRHGMRRIVLCLGYRGEMVRDHVGDGARWGVQCEYVFDGPVLQGTGGALREAAALLGELFWVTYGDSYMDIDYGAVLRAFELTSSLALMTVLANNNQWDRSNVVFREGVLVAYDKRHQTPDMKHIDYGVALLRKQALSTLPASGPADLADLYTGLAARGQLMGYEVTRRFYEIGSPAGLEEARGVAASWSTNPTKGLS